MVPMSLEEAAGLQNVSEKSFRDEVLDDLAIFETTFFRCEFVNCIFDGGRIGLSTFHDCQFIGCSFRDAKLQSCRFSGEEETQRCTWSRCDLSNAVLLKCDVSHNVFGDCLGFMLRLEDCDAGEAQLKLDVQRQINHRHIMGGFSCVRTKLQDADLNGLNLESSTFEFCDLRGANLAGCNLSSASFAGSNLNGTRLTRAVLTGASIAHAQIDELDLTEALTTDDLTISRDQQEKVLAQFRIRVLN